MIQELFGKEKQTILTLNRRNQKYIRPLNSSSAKRLADNKLLTKKVLNKLDIKTPDLYKVVRTKKQLEHVDWSTLPKSFVVKPNRGSVGSGILIFYGRRKNSLEWIRPNGQIMDPEDISLHMEKILEGRFSMGNKPDTVIVEERVKTDTELKRYSYKGVPDIRLIIFNNVPVMAMVRLPTKRSDGKANLHAGGICAGIDIASGITTYAMHMKEKSLLEDTYESLEFTYDMKQNLPLRGIKIPYWEEILETAVKCQQASNLGYLGVDIVVDRDKGPLVLELNARPGLGIQIANNAGLRDRLERVEGLKIKSVKHGIRVGKDLFGGEVEHSIEEMSGKKVVNLVEKVSISYRTKSKKEVASTLLDTSTISSRIDRGLANRLGYSDALKVFRSLELPTEYESYGEAQIEIDKVPQEILENSLIKRLAKITENGKIVIRPVIEIDIKISGVNKKIEAIISTRDDMIYSFKLGRVDLKDFLIDPSMTFTK